MTFVLFLCYVVVGFLVLLTFTPCNTGKNSFFDCSILNYFKILSRYVLIEKTYQASSSISIDLDAQYVSTFTRSFFEKLLSNTPLCFPENSTSFMITNMSHTYTYQKGC